MTLQDELDKTRAELADIERQLAAAEASRSQLVPGPGYGDAKARLTEEIRQLTKASAKWQRALRTLQSSLHASLQPKLL